MEMSKETEQKIAQLQLMEQNIQTLAIQRQNFQAQLMEIDNALTELTTAKAATYKIVGNIMLATDKETLQNDLKAKKEVIELRLKNIKKQEDAIREKAEDLQSEVIKELKPEKK